MSFTEQLTNNYENGIACVTVNTKNLLNSLINLLHDHIVVCAITLPMRKLV